MKTLIEILGFIFAIVVLGIGIIIFTLYEILKGFDRWYKKYGKWE